ncbi:MAG: thiamine phosphate synthase [Vicinamibacterales bacterium]
MILHLVTDRRRLTASAAWPEQRRCLRLQIRHAVEAGIDVVQLRERELDAASLLALAEDAVAEAAGSRTRIVLNDRFDVALAAGAHGVHLRSDSIAPAVVRRLVPPAFLIGRSVHSPEEAAVAVADVDYLIAGTVWPTASKRPGHALLGVAGLEAVVQAAAVPVLAIGGVTLDRVGAIAATRAAGVAAIGLFIADRPSADTGSTCRAMPLHDVARRSTVQFAAAAPTRT